jgi:hypothetical protein
MRPGNGSINFTRDLPLSKSAAIMALVDEDAGGVGAHIVITGVRVDPVGIGDAAMLAAATYTGRITARPSRTSLEFVGLGDWLNTYLDAEVSRTAGTITQWIGDLDGNDLVAGTVGTASNVTKTFPAHITTKREALDTVAGLGGWEYRIMPDFTIDADDAATLFRSPPEVVVTRKAEGPDGSLRGVDGSMLDQAINVANLATKAVALAQGVGEAIAKGTATTTRNLNAPLGSNAEFVTVFSAPGEESANANTAATNFLNLQGMRREVNVSSRTHHLPRYVVPGDYVYIYDIASGLVDTTTQVQFRGETIFPATVRCLSLTWPIERGCGVYIRSNAAVGSATIIDVTDWVEWESGDTWWTVGDWNPPNYGRVNRTNPEIEERIGISSEVPGVTYHGSINSGTSVVYAGVAGGMRVYRINLVPTGAIAAYTTLATLPTGFRPLTLGAHGGSRNETSGALGASFVATDGTVSIDTATVNGQTVACHMIGAA